MKAKKSTGQSGFSLIELTVALVVTLIVSGAIYGLLASGKSAFRRDPEMSDRQQNVRVAMSFIQRDLAAAGVSMGPFLQVFTNGLDSPAAAPERPNDAPGFGGANTDHLQMFALDGLCPSVPLEAKASSAKVAAFPPLGIPSCFPEPGMILLIGKPGGNIESRPGWGHKIGSFDNKFAEFPPGQQPPMFGKVLESPFKDNLVEMVPFQLVRYEIAQDPADPNCAGVTPATLIASPRCAPSLWRSISGGINAAGTYVPAPGAGGGWQLVARGIEDLQVRYRNQGAFAGLGDWSDTPGAVVTDTWTTIVKEVEVTLSARSMAPLLAGATQPIPAAPLALRGTLTSVTSPRSALFYLSGAPGTLWR